MNTIDQLKKHGVAPRLKSGGKIGLQGMGNLPDSIKTEIIAWAKANRQSLLKELTGGQEGQKVQKEVVTAPPKIMPMTSCLHGKPCRLLDSPGDRRPRCSKTNTPIFDMDLCPNYHWAKKQPKVGSYSNEA